VPLLQPVLKFTLLIRTCVCISGYELINGGCNEICGDGRVFDLACDDGNTLKGDGCSSSCTIENKYDCVNGTPTTPSICTYTGKLLKLKF
jgi:cysteine-rich repeat protein